MTCPAMVTAVYRRRLRAPWTAQSVCLREKGPRSLCRRPTRGKHRSPDGNDRPIHSRQPTRVTRRPRRENNRCNCQRHRRNDSESSLATAPLSVPVSSRYCRDSVRWRRDDCHAVSPRPCERRPSSVCDAVAEWAASDVDSSSCVLSSLRRPCCSTSDAAAKTRMNTRRRHHAPPPPSPPPPPPLSVPAGSSR